MGAASSNVSQTIPSHEDQVLYWNEWNIRFRNATHSLDAYQIRQIKTAIDLLLRKPSSRVLEIGCGTGWLAAALSGLSEVVGVDLSTEAIEEAKRRGSSATFLAGDVLSMDLPGKFDLVITVDTMAHVSDHAAFISKVSSLLNPGGKFLLMTQNSFVWNRNSQLMPLAKGQIRRWPKLADLRRLLLSEFQVGRVTSIMPAGDRGILRLANSRYCKGVLCKLLGVERQTGFFERLLIGKELVIVAARRA